MEILFIPVTKLVVILGVWSFRQAPTSGNLSSLPDIGYYNLNLSLARYDDAPVRTWAIVVNIGHQTSGDYIQQVFDISGGQAYFRGMNNNTPLSSWKRLDNE